MFQSLQDGLQRAFKSLRGKGKLTESNMRDGLRIVEESLLEADVSYSVVQDFMARVSEKAMGTKVITSLNPDQQLFYIVHQELIELLGPEDPQFHLKQKVNVLMLCGLQGSGKTTTCGKLAKLLLGSDIRTMLVAADLQRPAAIDQLHVIGEQVGVPVYSNREEKNPVKLCQDAVKKATDDDIQVVILDTAGRLAIDKELMDQLNRIADKVQVDQVYFVVDGMTGQDAVNSAQAFQDALELDGVIMTKLDGDARGGALLSVKEVTEVPIKFIGTGEQLDSLEPFRPEGMAGRILGHGDMVELARVAQELVDSKEQAEMEENWLKGQFSLDDFKKHLSKLTNPGLMTKMLGLIPGAGQLKEAMQNEDASGDAKRLIGIINSMTPDERKNPKAIDPSRRLRIANGAGVQAHQVNELVKQYDGMKEVMTSMAGLSMRDRMKKMQEMQDGGMLDPSSRMKREKKSTGTRLSPKQKKQLRKKREAEMRKRKRLQRGS